MQQIFSFVNGKKFQLERIYKLCNLDKRLFICKWRSKFQWKRIFWPDPKRDVFSGSKDIRVCRLSRNNWRIPIVSYSNFLLYVSSMLRLSVLTWNHFQRKKKMTDIAQEIREIFLPPTIVCILNCLPEGLMRYVLFPWWWKLSQMHRWLSFVWWWHKITWMNKYL